MVPGRRCLRCGCSSGSSVRRTSFGPWGQSQVSEPAAPDEPLSRLSMTVLMTPDMSNFSGNVHGGLLLKLLDQVAYTCASRYARAYAVTLSVDQVVFREPVHVGELVTFAASVNYTGRTSME